MQHSIHGTATEPPLVSGEPIREWAFSELRGDSLEEVELDDGIQVGGLLHELHDFGPTSRDSDVFDPGILVSGLARDNVDGYGVARLSPQC